MVFASLLFIAIFLPAVLIMYFVAPKKLRNLVLFLTSLVFYAWGEPIYIVLMIFSTFFDFTAGILIDKFKRQNKMFAAKCVLFTAMFMNLLFLCFFKYTDFFIRTINSIFGLQIPMLNLPLPIGISFYTFHTMSYTIDVYRGDAAVQKNIISFGTYITMFPQLIAGPIIRYKTISDQIDGRKENVSQFADGVKMFSIGMAKKVILANNIGLLWSQVQGLMPAEVSVVTAWIGIIAFTFQIYFDFSGYSDMAIGLGKMFGFEFLRNFEYPYIARSITEFWRRWHISLSTWFREYVYIPLGGNRTGKLKQYRNLLIVWFLTGLWHGASWNYVLWGLYFFVILVMEKAFMLKLLEKLPKFFQHSYAIILIILGWVLFSFENLPAGWVFLQKMFGVGAGTGFIDGQALYFLSNYGLILAICIVASTPILANLWQKLHEKRDKIAEVLIPILSVAALFVSIAYLVDGTYNPFIYFKF
jgi:alginate O-acetyltransferase complex protein AlgI